MKKKLTELTDEELQKFYQITKNKVSEMNTKQYAVKISLNSLYGALGNQYFRYFDIRMAEAVTITGQFVIRYLEKGLNNYLNKILGNENVAYCIAGDTDSIYVTFADIVEKFIPKDKHSDKNHIVNILDKFSQEKVGPLLEQLCEEIVEYLNCPNRVLKMDREVISDKGIWIAKKRYMLNVLDKEGVRFSKPKLKMMGIEAVKTSTPSAFRKNIEMAIEILMNGTEHDLQEFIKDFRKNVKTLPIEEIAFPRGTSDLEKYQRSGEVFAKGTPIHVRAAILFNFLLQEKNLTSNYESIRSGDKIKFVYLKTPNPLKENVIGFMNEFPEEFGLRKFIDFDTQFEKGFLKPLELITDIIKWETSKRNKLSDFFV